MTSKSFWNQAHPQRQINSRWTGIVAVAALAFSLMAAPSNYANDAPAWMHGLASVPLPEHDDKTDAVLLYSEYVLTVQPNGKIKGLERAAYKILRVGGKRFGAVRADFDADTKILAL